MLSHSDSRDIHEPSSHWKSDTPQPVAINNIKKRGKDYTFREKHQKGSEYSSQFSKPRSLTAVLHTWRQIVQQNVECLCHRYNQCIYYTDRNHKLILVIMDGTHRQWSSLVHQQCHHWYVAQKTRESQARRLRNQLRDFGFFLNATPCNVCTYGVWLEFPKDPLQVMWTRHLCLHEKTSLEPHGGIERRK